MAGRTRNIIVGFDANTRGFTRGAREVDQRLKRIQQSVRQTRAAFRRLNRAVTNSVKQMASMRNVAASLAGTGGLGLLAKKSADLGASLFEAAQRIGVATEDLQALQRVLEGDGVAIETTNKMLVQFAQRAREAAKGTKTYAEVFDRLGVTVTDADGNLRPVMDLFRETADGMARLSSRTEQSALGMTLFGTRAAGVINVLQQGGPALDAALEQFKALGVITTREAAGLKVLSQEFTNSGNAIQAGLAKAIADIGPQIYTALKAVTEFATYISVKLVEAIGWVIENFGYMGDVLRVVAAIFLASKISIRAIILSIATYVKGMALAIAATLTWGKALAAVGRLLRFIARLLVIGFIIEGIILAVTATEELVALLESIGGVFDKLWLVAKGWAAQVRKEFLDISAGLGNFLVEMVNTVLGWVSHGIDKIRQAIVFMFTSISQEDLLPESMLQKFEFSEVSQKFKINYGNNILRTIEEGKEAMAGLGQSFDQVGDRAKELFEKWKESWSFLSDDFKNGKIEVEDYEKEIQKLLDALKKLGDAPPPDFDIEDPCAKPEKIKKVVKEVTEGQRAIERFSQRIGDAFGQTVEDVVTGAATIGEALKQLVRDIVKAVLRAAVINPIAGAISTGIQSFIGGITLPGGTGPGSGLGGAGPAGVAAERRIPLSEVFGRAQGGPVSANRPYMVGERGPELFVPGSSGNIVSNANLGGGQPIINFSPVINGGDPALIRSEVEKSLPTFRDVVEASIMQKMARPSAMRQAVYGT